MKNNPTQVPEKKSVFGTMRDRAIKLLEWISKTNAQHPPCKR